MEEGLKQRIVGAAVLVLLAVIFIPMLLESEPEQGELGLELGPSPSADSDFSSRIIPLDQPEVAAPEADSLPVPDPVPAGEEEEQHAASGTTVPPEVPPLVTVAPDDPGDSEALAAVVLEPGEAADGDETPTVPEEAGAASEPGEAQEQSPSLAWAAQLGSFAERRNALVLRNRLRAQGYRAFTESSTSEQGEVTRVLVGPEPSRDQTVATIEALRRDTGLDGFVVRHPRD